MVGTYYGIAHYQMGFLLGLKAFSAAVLGGIGNLAGAMLGGAAARRRSRRSAPATSAISPTCASSSGWSDAIAERCVDRSEPHALRQQLPGRVRVPRADRRAGLPAVGPARRARRRPGVTMIGMTALLDPKKHPRGRLDRHRADRRRAGRAAVRAGGDRHRVGADHQPRDPVRAAVARAQHRRRLRRACSTSATSRSTPSAPTSTRCSPRRTSTCTCRSG